MHKEFLDSLPAEGRTLYKIGVNLSSETRQMTEWKVEENSGRTALDEIRHFVKRSHV